MYAPVFFISLLFLSNVLGEVDQSGWIDPHDMTPVYDKEFFPYPYDDIKESPKVPHIYENCDQTESQSKAYLKRIINMIINAVHEDAFDESRYKGHLTFDISADKYLRLQEFTNNKFDDLHEVDLILSEILHKPSTAYLKEYFMGWCVSAFKSVTSRASIVFICILSCVFVVYKMIQGRLNYWAILKFLFITLIVIDFAFVWIRLYEEAEIDKMADTIKFSNLPNYCNPKSMTYLQSFWNAFSTTDRCKEYYHLTYKDIFYTVSPGDVFSEMLTQLLIRPLKKMGPAIGGFVFGIYGSLPFPMNIFLLIPVLIFVMIMTCILLSFILNVPIKFNFFHLISFAFGDRGYSTNGNVLTGRTVEQLLDIVKDNQPPRYLSETTNSTASTFNRMSIRNEDISHNNEEIRSRYTPVTNEEMRQNNDGNKCILERNKNLRVASKPKVLKKSNLTVDQSPKYLLETTNPTVSTTNRMTSRNEDISQYNEDISARYSPITNSNVTVGNRMSISNEEMSQNNEDKNSLQEASTNLTASKLNVLKEEIIHNYEERKPNIENSIQLTLNDESNLKRDKEERKASIDSSRASPRGDFNLQRENYEAEVEDLIKGFEATVVEDIITEIKGNEDGVRKRKREEGAGDM